MFEEQLARIKEKLTWLKNADRQHLILDGFNHSYELNPKLSAEQVENFERQYQITLPQGFRLFLLEIGNGGVGPYYGLVKLEDSLYSDMDHRRESEKVNPSLPFPHTEPQYMFPENYDESEDSDREKIYEYWSEPLHEQGILRICNYGCGIFIDLVVSGVEYGNIWVSDIGNDHGIFPVGIIEDKPNKKIGFLDWYENWLDECLDKIKSGKYE
jgi:SMI1 / KNR4 family (SUKH-1)